MGGYLILFCDKHWRMLGVSGAESLRAAKKEVEGYYLGIESKWVAVDTPVKAAKQWLAAQYPQDVCSFCGHFSYDARVMFLGPKAVVCSNCVEAFAQELKKESESE
ncbi:ClpX C4-type zinc finger [compost metagenome]